MVTEEIKKIIKQMQKNEITEYYIYTRIARRLKNERDREILKKIATQEKAHAEIWGKYTGVKVKPSKIKIFFYRLLSALLGYTFTLKILERGEDKAQKNYSVLIGEIPEAEKIIKEESEHEHELISMLNEERLNYVGSIVLGLNDALVELSGALAGLSFALSDSRIISLTGLITGIAASLSMAASEYLSAKAEGRENPLKSALYTGVAYIITVGILILPFILFAGNRRLALGVMLFSVIFIIFVFNFYISVAKDLSFKKRFFQMSAISLGVALISFAIGLLVKGAFGIDV
ncbi:MAG: VIT1/CCC1 transporter family protein [Bacilli bacterium]|jgi:VIT1/CCC1 family predicted Fe2+/Mn2+ transporter|nr:VIT1/CCC1 transporter family protein [Bacilli bacterium]HPZ27509.1 VIT1/CCC1 transporter family protein [Bacilli bacterium]HQC89770.1 VIT1/CCC1 transporter family protein [Bacilli bacterium]